MTKKRKVRDKLLTYSEVCDLIGYTRNGIYKMILRGEFPDAIRVTDKRLFWKLSVVKQWLKGEWEI